MNTLPPVTEPQRRAAFTLLAWKGYTFEECMKDTQRRKLIEACAGHLRTRDWEAQHGRLTEPVRRYNPRTGRWVTTLEPGWFDGRQMVLVSGNAQLTGAAQVPTVAGMPLRRPVE
jgi:hypothetical protein